MKSSELEKKAREERQQLENSIDDLNQELSPGQLLDKYYFHGEGASGYLRHLKEDPIPGALVGAAIVWSSGREGIKQTASSAGSTAKSKFSEAGHKLSEKKGSAGNRVASAKDSAKQKAGHAREAAVEKAGHARDRAAEKAGYAMQEADRNLREHPLMSIAVGFSLGAALGGLTPITQAEKEAVKSAAGKAKQTREQASGQQGMV